MSTDSRRFYPHLTFDNPTWVEKSVVLRVRNIRRAPPTFAALTLISAQHLCRGRRASTFMAAMGERHRSRREEFELVPSPLRHWLVGRALVAGLAMSCYVNSIWGDFVFDDSEAVVKNKDVDPGASSLADVFSHDFWGSNISSRSSHKSYRPLTVLSFRLSFWLAGGREPFHFHLANVLLHPLVCLLLLEVLNNWFSQLKTGSKPVSWVAPIAGSEALVASLLFAVHPIHTESVSLY